jgi:ATP-dependent Clp protease ATP-binding subunit ClpA
MEVQSYDRFTKRAKHVLQLAGEESRAFNHPYIGTEHILLGMIREGEGIAARMLDQLGVKPSQARHAVEFIVGFGQQPPTESRDLTERAGKLIEYAVEEAQRMNHHYIGTEHLLLGLVKLREGVATGALDVMGVGLDDVRFEVMRILRQGNIGSPPQVDASIRDQIKLVYGNFTRRARSALNAAAEEASTLGHPHIGPEHLLAGLIREQEGLAGRVLEQLGVMIIMISQTIEGDSPKQTPTDWITLSDATKLVVAHAAEEALLRNHEYLGTEHLLLALCRELSITAIFAQANVTPEQVRNAVFEALAQQSEIGDWRLEISL